MPRMKGISKGTRRGGMQGLPKRRTSMGVSGKRGSTPSGPRGPRGPRQAQKRTLGSGSRPSQHGLGSTSTAEGTTSTPEQRAAGMAQSGEQRAYLRSPRSTSSPRRTARRRRRRGYNFTKNIGLQEIIMPKGKGTYGHKRGRPVKKKPKKK